MLIPDMNSSEGGSLFSLFRSKINIHVLDDPVDRLGFLDGSSHARTHRYCDEHYGHWDSGHGSLELTGDLMAAFPRRYACKAPPSRAGDVETAKTYRVHYMPAPPRGVDH